MSTPRHQFNYSNGDETVCITTTAITLSELVEKFEDYLKACGFHFEGRVLDFVDEEEMPEVPEATIIPFPPSGYVPPVTSDLNPSEDKETST